jgi:20S proteasome alpha/beta subunit
MCLILYFLLIRFCRLDGCYLPLNGRNILAFAGLMEHARPLEERVDIEITEHRRHYDVSHLIPISPELVALKVADVQYQLCHTKTGGGYPLFTFIAGFDIFTGQPELYAVDFRGRVGRFGAYAAGRGLELMNKFLRNNYQKEYYSARELAIRALLEVNSLSFSLFGLRVIYYIFFLKPMEPLHFELFVIYI